jgi:hypothetical protein
VKQRNFKIIVNNWKTNKQTKQPINYTEACKE